MEFYRKTPKQHLIKIYLISIVLNPCLAIHPTGPLVFGATSKLRRPNLTPTPLPESLISVADLEIDKKDNQHTIKSDYRNYFKLIYQIKSIQL